MAKNGVCKKCNNLVNGWCEKVIDSPDPDMVRDCRHFWEKTNADRIRAMSDDELADFIDAPTLCKGHGLGDCLSKDCKKCISEWLKQPAEEEAKQECRYNRNGHCMGQKLMPECDAKNCDRKKP